ncbi:MAG: PEP-CTERM sorting domain-containing protein [Planctomycetota bacterium]
MVGNRRRHGGPVLARAAVLAVAAAVAGPAAGSVVTPASLMEGELRLTLTLESVTVQNTQTQSRPAAVPSADFSLNAVSIDGVLTDGGDPANPAGSVGGGTAGRSVTVNGAEVPGSGGTGFSLGVGDAFVLVLTASASAETPGSVFFGSATGGVGLGFVNNIDELEDPEEQAFTYSFGYTAELIGAAAGGFGPDAMADLRAVGLEVGAVASDPDGSAVVSVVSAIDFFTLEGDGTDGGVAGIRESASGRVDVVLEAGDVDPLITFRADLLARAGVPVPEPSAAALLAAALGGGWVLAGRRRRLP